jgi:hypothetical protein
MTPAERLAFAGVFCFPLLADGRSDAAHHYTFSEGRKECLSGFLRDAWIRDIALFAGGVPREVPTRDADRRADEKTRKE